MKKILLFSFFLASYAFAQAQSSEDKWKLFAVEEGGVEVYIDTTSIARVKLLDKNSFAYKVISKKYYPDSIGRAEYLNKIRSAYNKLEKKPTNVEKRMKKWQNFSYTIIEYQYDCMGKAYKTGVITEYDNQGKIIIKTKTPDKSPWVKTGVDDVGDLMLFHVCDSGL